MTICHSGIDSGHGIEYLPELKTQLEIKTLLHFHTVEIPRIIDIEFKYHSFSIPVNGRSLKTQCLQPVFQIPVKTGITARKPWLCGILSFCLNG